MFVFRGEAIVNGNHIKLCFVADFRTDIIVAVQIANNKPAAMNIHNPGRGGAAAVMAGFYRTVDRVFGRNTRWAIFRKMLAEGGVKSALLIKRNIAAGVRIKTLCFLDEFPCVFFNELLIIHGMLP